MTCNSKSSAEEEACRREGDKQDKDRFLCRVRDETRKNGGLQKAPYKGARKRDDFSAPECTQRPCVLGARLSPAYGKRCALHA